MLAKSNAPKISVLIPVYNVEKYVERCIISVLNQTMQEGVEVTPSWIECNEAGWK